MAHFNESVNRQLVELDGSVNLRNRDLSTEIDQLKNSVNALDQTKLVDIFSNRTIILRDQLVDKISELKQRFLDNQKNVNSKQRIMDENSKTFMATVNSKLIESKHEFTKLASKLTNVIKENNKIQNSTHKMTEEFRKNVSLFVNYLLSTVISMVNHGFLFGQKTDHTNGGDGSLEFRILTYV